MDAAITDKKSSKTFSITSLLVVTTLIAVHCAFPWMLQVWGISFGFAVALFMVLMPFWAFVALMSPPADNGQLDIEKNRLLKGGFWLYLIAVVGFFLFVFLAYFCDAVIGWLQSFFGP